MTSLQYLGSTSDFLEVRPGIVAKLPKKVWEQNPNHTLMNQANINALNIERQILEHLGQHDRIVPHYGRYGEFGIQLAKASHGNLQCFIDTNNHTITTPLRWQWVLQAGESIAFLHSKGVVHSDLRPENVLVDSAAYNLWLCDFGGSTCEELGLDGGQLPDDPFCDPLLPWTSMPATDIFSLGSIFYAIMTGFWPFRTAPPPHTVDEKCAFEAEANARFKAGEFPDVSKIPAGEVINGCWHHTYSTAEQVVMATELEMAKAGRVEEETAGECCWLEAVQN